MVMKTGKIYSTKQEELMLRNGIDCTEAMLTNIRTDLLEDTTQLPESMYAQAPKKTEADRYVESLADMVPVARCQELTEKINDMLMELAAQYSDEAWENIQDYLTAGMQCFQFFLYNNTEDDTEECCRLMDMEKDEYIAYLLTYFSKLQSILKNGEYAGGSGRRLVQSYNMVVGAALRFI